jgi:hypothetical protein
MTGEAFQPLGEQARWRTIYDLLVKLGVDEVVTYERLAAELGLNAESDRAAVQMAARRAIQELLKEEKRTCEPVRNVGYRVVEPKKHLDLARGRNKRARVQMRAGYDVATHVDLNAVEPEVRAALEVIAQGFAQQMEINRRVISKQKKHDDAIELLMRRVEDLENRKGPTP